MVQRHLWYGEQEDTRLLTAYQEGAWSEVAATGVLGTGQLPRGTRDKNARVITPDPRGWNALRRDNIFLCNHGC